MKVLVVFLLVGGLAGCATRTTCDPQSDAREAVAQGIPVGELGARYPACSDRLAEIRDAHAQAVEERCLPADAWRSGLDGGAPDPVCEELGGLLWREGHGLGQRYAEFRRELASIRAAQQKAAGRKAAHLRLEERRVTREMEQIEAVARIRGWPLEGVQSPIERAISEDQ